MVNEEKTEVAATLRAAAGTLDSNSLSSAFTGYLYKKPLSREEMKSMVLRALISEMEDGSNPDSSANALKYLVYAYHARFGGSGFVKGGGAERIALALYKKAAPGAEDESFYWPDIMEIANPRVGWPKWALKAIGDYQAEENEGLRQYAKEHLGR